jgi:hypothetical protein
MINQLDIKYHLLELVKFERSLGNNDIEYRECKKCGFPFVTEDDSEECIICSGKMKPLHTAMTALCPICGCEFDCGGKTACSIKCVKKSNKLGIKRKERRDMIEKGLVLSNKPKRNRGGSPGWSGKEHPWKSVQRGSYENI